MPEGPELHLASRFVNASCKDRIFTGKIVKSAVHKSSEVPFEAKAYTITASSRGKEMQLILSSADDGGGKSETKSKTKAKIKADPDVANCTKILFRFGMSGKFEFTSEANVHKHAHLKFFTKDKSPMVLSHVDVRRFGRWEVDADWSKGRGPDPMFEYREFRANVLNNLDNSAFNQPICEVLLNQKYFNGIGNYLRSEILYRLRIPPFERARTVLEGLSIEPPDAKPSKTAGKKGKDPPDILHLCHTVPLEVLNIGGGGYDPEGNKSDYNTFTKWLQCYYQDGMNNMVDHNGRTIWFKGPAGPMVPREGKSRSKKAKRRKGIAASTNAGSEADDGDSSPQKKVKQSASKTPVKTGKKTRTSKKEAGKPTASEANTSDSIRTASRMRRKSIPNDGAINGAKKMGNRRRLKKSDSIPKPAPAPKKSSKTSKKKPTRKRTTSMK